MAKKWDKYKKADKKWDKYLTKEAPVEETSIDIGGVSIPEESRIAFVHNNPGNLMFAGQSAAEKGESRGKGNWAKFNSPKEGFDALVDQVKLDQSRDLTVSQFMNKYAPPSENDTNAYIESFTEKVGVKANEKLSSADALNIAKFIAQRESNTKIGKTPEQPKIEEPTRIKATPLESEELGTWDKIQNSIENAVGQTRAARYDISQALNIPLSYGDKGIAFLGDKLGLKKETTDWIRQAWQRNTSFGPGIMGPLGLIDPSTQSALQSIEFLFLDKDERAEFFKGQTYPEKRAEQAEKASEARGVAKETGSILTGIKEGDAGEIAAGAVDGVLGFVPSLIVGLTTGGTGFVPWVTGMELNESVKAEASMTDKQIEDVFNKGDENIGTSLFVGVTTGLLERYGFSKLTKYLKNKEISKSFAQRFKTLMTETGRQGVINWLEAGLNHYSKSYTELEAGTEDKSIESKISNQEEAAKSGAEFLISEEGIDAGIKAMAGSFVLGAGKNVGRSFTPKSNAKIQKVEIADGETSAMIETEEGVMVLKDKLNKEDADAAQKHLSKKYPSSEFEVIGVVDSKGDFVEGKYTVEQRSFVEAEQKLAETDKKKVEEEKKLAEKKTEISEIEKVEISKKEKSSQKEKPITEPDLQKKKLEDTKQPEKIKQDGKLRDGDGTKEKKVPGVELQEKPGIIQQQKEQAAKESKEKSERDTKDAEKEAQVAIENGKIKKSKNFLKDVKDEVTRKLVERKTNRLLREKQKALDEDVKKIDETIDKIDKEGISVDHTVKGDVEKRYMVKKKPDGTFSVVSLHDRDASDRPKRVTNVKLKTDILKKYRAQRKIDVEKIKAEKTKEITDRHTKEINEEISKYVKDREKPIETEPGKPTGEEKPTPPVKPKKDKMPSAGKKVLVNEMAAIKDEIKTWTKMAVKEGREVKKELATAKRSIKKVIKDSLKEAKIKGLDKRDAVAFMDKVEKATKENIEQLSEEAATLVDKIAGKQERESILKQIDDILTKKRTITTGGKKKSKTNKQRTKDGEPLVDSEGNPITGTTGVAPEIAVYLKKVAEIFNSGSLPKKDKGVDVISLSKISDKIDRLKSKKKLTNDEQNRLSELEQEYYDIADKLSQKEAAAVEKFNSAKTDLEKRDAAAYILAAKEIGSLGDLTNEKLGKIRDLLIRRETDGAKRLNTIIDKAIASYKETSDIIEESLAGYEYDLPTRIKKTQRRQKFDSDKAKALAIKNNIPAKIKWWRKEVAQSVRERGIYGLDAAILQPIAHLETTLHILDSSKDQRLKNKILDAIRKSSHAEAAGLESSQHKAYGELLEAVNPKLIQDLKKKYGDHDNIVSWLIENKEMNKKLQRKIYDETNNALQDLYRANKKGDVLIEVNGKKEVAFLNALDAMKIVAWSKNPVLAKKLESMGIDKEKIENEIEPLIPKSAESWRVSIMEDFMPSDVDKTSKVFEKMNRVPLKTEENYFPAKVDMIRNEFSLKDKSVYQGAAGQLTSFLIERTKNNNPLKILKTDNYGAPDFVDILNEYIRESEHYKAWAETAKEMDVILNHPKFKFAARSIGLYDLIRRQIDANVNGGYKVQSDYATGVFEKLMSKFASIKLGFKPNMVPKQATSAIEGLGEADSAYAWMKHTTALFLNPVLRKKMHKKFYNGSPIYKKRVDSGLKSDPDMRGAGVGFGVKKRSLKGKPLGFETKREARLLRIKDKIINSYIPKGDQMGVMLGYYPIYKEAIKAGKSEHEAMLEFERYESTQQPRTPLYMNSVQMQKGMTRLATMFKSSQMGYANKSIQAIVSIKRDISRGEKPKGKDVRKLVINAWVSNVLFSSMQNLPYAVVGGWDEYLKKMNRAFIAGPFNGLFLLGDVAEWAAGKYFAGEKFGISLTRDIGPIITDPAKMLDKAFKEKDYTELVKGLATVVAYSRGLPAPTMMNAFEGIADAGDGDITVGMLKTLGWTDNQIEDAIGKKEAAIKEGDDKDPYSFLIDDSSEKEEEAKKKWHWEEKETKDKYSHFFDE